MTQLGPGQEMVQQALQTLDAKYAEPLLVELLSLSQELRMGSARMVGFGGEKRGGGGSWKKMGAYLIRLELCSCFSLRSLYHVCHGTRRLSF